MSQKTGWYLIRIIIFQKRVWKLFDVIEAFTFDLKGIEAADTANIIKYACRWKKKNGIQDLEKILWYTQHLIDHLKKTEKVEEENK